MTITARSWELEQLVKLSQQQPELVDRGIHKLLAQDDNLRWA